MVPTATYCNVAFVYVMQENPTSRIVSANIESQFQHRLPTLFSQAVNGFSRLEEALLYQGKERLAVNRSQFPDMLLWLGDVSSFPSAYVGSERDKHQIITTDQAAFLDQLLKSASYN